MIQNLQTDNSLMLTPLGLAIPAIVKPLKFIDLPSYLSLITLVENKALVVGSSYRFPYYGVFVQPYVGAQYKDTFYPDKTLPFDAIVAGPANDFLTVLALSEGVLASEATSSKYIDDIVYLNYVYPNAFPYDNGGYGYDISLVTYTPGIAQTDIILEPANWYASNGDTFSDMLNSTSYRIQMYGDIDVVTVPFTVVDAATFKVRINVDITAIFSTDSLFMFYYEILKLPVVVFPYVSRRTQVTGNITANFDWRYLYFGIPTTTETATGLTFRGETIRVPGYTTNSVKTYQLVFNSDVVSDQSENISISLLYPNNITNVGVSINGGRSFKGSDIHLGDLDGTNVINGNGHINIPICGSVTCGPNVLMESVNCDSMRVVFINNSFFYVNGGTIIDGQFMGPFCYSDFTRFGVIIFDRNSYVQHVDFAGELLSCHITGDTRYSVIGSFTSFSGVLPSQTTFTQTLTALGNVKAATFIGDGSQLTGLPASGVAKQYVDTADTIIQTQVTSNTNSLALKADLVNGIVPVNQLPAVANVINVPTYQALLDLIANKALVGGIFYRFPYYYARVEYVLSNGVNSIRLPKALLYNATLVPLDGYNYAPASIPAADVEYIIQQAIGASTLAQDCQSEMYSNDVLTFDHSTPLYTNYQDFNYQYDPAFFTLYQGQTQIDITFPPNNFYGNGFSFADSFDVSKYRVNVYGDSVTKTVPFVVLDAAAGLVRVAVDAYAIYANPINRFYAEMIIPGVLISANVTSRNLKAQDILCSFDFRNMRTTVYQRKSNLTNELFWGEQNQVANYNADLTGIEDYFLPFHKIAIEPTRSSVGVVGVNIQTSFKYSTVILSTNALPDQFASIVNIRLGNVVTIFAPGASDIVVGFCSHISAVGPNAIVNNFSAEIVNSFQSCGSVTNFKARYVNGISVGPKSDGTPSTVDTVNFLSDVIDATFSDDVIRSVFTGVLGNNRTAGFAKVVDSIVGGSSSVPLINEVTLGSIWPSFEAPILGTYLTKENSEIIGEFRFSNNFNGGICTQINLVVTLSTLFIKPEPGVTAQFGTVTTVTAPGQIQAAAAATLLLDGNLGHYLRVRKCRITPNPATPETYSEYWRIIESFTA